MSRVGRAPALLNVLKREGRPMWCGEICACMGLPLHKMESLRDPLNHLVRAGIVSRHGTAPGRVYYSLNAEAA